MKPGDRVKVEYARGVNRKRFVGREGVVEKLGVGVMVGFVLVKLDHHPDDVYPVVTSFLPGDLSLLQPQTPLFEQPTESAPRAGGDPS